MNDMENSAPPSEGAPWDQPVTVIRPDGKPFPIPMAMVDQLRLYGGRLAISYGTQIGASFILLLVLLLLTRAEKRKSSIFIINGLCLLTNTIRCVLLSCYITSTWFHPYAQLLGFFENVSRRDEHTMVAMNTLSLIVMILVMISLSLQVYVVCITTAPAQRFIIMGVTTIMALLATGYKFAFVILSTKVNLERGDHLSYARVRILSYITQAVSIWVFSCVFTYKLGHAIIQRRKLNMPQFGPMQIVFIMGCQTLIIPGTPPITPPLSPKTNSQTAIFSTLQFRDEIPELGSQVLTVVCIFLPLSAIWAGVVNETAVATKGPDGHHRLIQDAFYRESAGSTVGGSSMEKSRQMSVCTCATHKGVESAQNSPLKSSRRNGNEDNDDIGREFGFSQRTLGRESV